MQRKRHCLRDWLALDLFRNQPLEVPAALAMADQHERRRDPGCFEQRAKLAGDATKASGYYAELAEMTLQEAMDPCLELADDFPERTVSCSSGETSSNFFPSASSALRHCMNRSRRFLWNHPSSTCSVRVRSASAFKRMSE